MKNSYCILVVLLLTGVYSLCAQNYSNLSGWDRFDSVLHVITGADTMLMAQQPVRLLTEFGAKPCIEGKRPNSKPAFDKAMHKAASSSKGMHLVVPKGEWFVKGPIHLVSNLTIELEEGATLLFSDQAEDYLPMVLTSWEGCFCMNYSPFIYGHNLKNVAIIGSGTIDGNCVNTFPLWRKSQKADQTLLRDMDHREIPVQERAFGQGHVLRPHLLQFYGCTNITLEGVLITNSPFWCVHLLQSENIVCRALRYDAKLVNNDGIDPEMSRDILIEDICFNNGDDNVAVKAGRDNDGWNGIPSENIIIRNCQFKGLHGLVIGSEMSAGVRYVYVENCTYGGYVKRGLYVKTNPNRGGFVHDIYFRNCSFGEVEDLFYITSMYAGEGADDNHYTDVHDIYVENVHAEKVHHAAIVLQGSGSKPLRNISFTNLSADSCQVGFTSIYAPDVVLTDCQLGGSATEAPSQASPKDYIFSLQH